MSVPSTVPECEQSRGEELANSLSHGLGLVAALVAGPYLVIQAADRGNTAFLVGASLFAVAVVLLYLFSTVYHALPIGNAKQVLRVIDHSAIFLLIAGTYTPFTLGVLRGPWGWTLLGLVWGLAAAGVALKAFDRLSHSIVSTGFYLLLGWIGLIVAGPLWTLVPASGLRWLVGGGVAYTAGVPFFATDTRLRYGHFIWHLFVVVGTTCHYFAVIGYGA